MKKILKASFNLLYTYVRFSFIKLFNYKSFTFTLLNHISPFTEINLNRGGKLSFGNRTKIRSGTKISLRKEAEIIIKDNVFLNHGCMIVCHEKIHIGDNVQIGPNVLMYDHDHDFRHEDGLKALKYKTSPIKIGENVWVGANTVILKGTTIGDNCVIGAGSVIRGDFPNNSIVMQKRENKISTYIRE
ncbi:acyltransferase [Planococcus liqunii]|uniref:acyltransferase n=1 Tax=Planococcus liqunii TaxID=3058394 RepID=UPI002606DDA7|nr:acyltransferase [Planococcus sp. N056]WKA50219.1 acyltransferase [Planococcus sp. N056]